ncbi:hypothetical protein HYT02_00055 [Candidatus Gottesmanbacteria bacterium]|nr:hypothetical protein [Candidatus Gottesmanbacteria bacterium]
MSQDQIRKILLEIGYYTSPSLTWKKKTRENIIFFARTHIPVISTHKAINLKLVFAISSFVLVLFISIPVTQTLASQSKPGDKLYPVGRFFEKAKLAIASDSQKKELIKKQLEKRVDEFEYIAQQENSEYEQEIAQELITHTEKVISNDRFTLDEKREIAGDIKDRLENIKENSNKEFVTQSIDNINSVFSQTEIKIEHKNADNSKDKDDENIGVGGMDEKDSQKVPEELKKIEDNSKFPL